MRWEDKRRGKGKRSGIRILYIVVSKHAHILLMEAYGKGEADDISADEKKVLRLLAEAYRQSLDR